MPYSVRQRPLALRARWISLKRAGSELRVRPDSCRDAERDGDQYPLIEIALVCAASPELLKARPMAPSTWPSWTSRWAYRMAHACASSGWCGWVRTMAARMRGNRYRWLSWRTRAFRPALLEALAQHGRDCRLTFENGSLERMAATVRADLTVSAWLASTVPVDLQILPPGVGLRELPLFAINLHVPPHAPSPAVRIFTKHVRDGLTRSWAPAQGKKRAAP